MKNSSSIACVLAAGLGKRLKHYTAGNPKWMISVSGKTLVQRYFDVFIEAGISRVIVVCGYKASVLKDYIESISPNLEIDFVENNRYSSTNNISSLGLALDFLRTSEILYDRIFLCECDIYIDHKHALDFLTSQATTPQALVSSYRYWMDGTKVSLSPKDGAIDALYGNRFETSVERDLYKTVNWYSFDKEFFQNCLYDLYTLYVSHCGEDQYYENILKLCVAAGIQPRIVPFKIDNRYWHEIDDEYDLNYATSLASFNEGDGNDFVTRFGGYWKSDWLIDLSLLINPFFPTSEFKKEINRQNDRLLTNYPSSQTIISSLIAKSFNCPGYYLSAVNGVSEAMSILLEKVDDSFQINQPYFLEYKRVLGDRLSYIDSFEVIDPCKSLIIINPNNPTGDFIPVSEVLKIASTLKRNNKYLIYDESFCDFCIDQNLSLLDTELLEAAPNIIVFKSLGKTYGVPGVRLGVIATSDPELSEDFKAALPIWNINSYAETFLELLPRYKDDYRQSLVRVHELTQSLYRDLTELQKTNIKAYPPSANFILVEFKNRSDCLKIARDLLDFSILVKPILDRPGLGPNCIRFAIHSSKVSRILVNLFRDL